MDLNLNLIRYDIEKAMKEIGEKYGFESTLGPLTYSDFGFRATIAAKALEVNGKSGAQVEYEKFSSKFGISPNTFGKVFEHNGRNFQIIGINPKARTMPILAVEVGTHSEYKFSAEFGKRV